MSLYGMLRTGASGMAAQAERLGTVSDNIANSSTTGYKRASAEFSSFILESGTSAYQPGSVEVTVRRNVTQQGGFTSTSSTTDLAVKGDGFFVVSGPDNQPVLTRAGSFVKDGEGNLVNAAGFKLLGYPSANGAGVANGFAGLEAININTLALQANPTTAGTLSLNLPSNADIIAAANLPGENIAASTFTGKTSLVTYDNLGNEVTLDIYLAKSAANEWEISAFNRADAATGGVFPYGASASAPLASATLTFDGTTGRLATASPTSLSLTIPNGQSFTLDLGETSQLATGYSVLEASVNGNAPSEVDRVEISSGGELSAVYQNGARVTAYRIPLATVPSPDNLTALAGNVFSPGILSGAVQIGVAGAGGLGTIVSSALEQSTVDLATELTTMIESQRNYVANSKVFQTGAELLDVLVNLQR